MRDMPSACGPQQRDLLCSGTRMFLFWCLPSFAFALGFFVSPGLKTVLWTLSLGFMGTVCLLNASRCCRIHCYFNGPYFFSFTRQKITFTKKDSMRLKFYGTRGSITTCDASFQQLGGNTTCLQITFTDMNRIAIIDAGTGLRNLGRDLRAIGHKQDRIVIAFTHFHWDHIQGFPFFAQAYDPGQKIKLLTLGRDQTITNLREIFEVQMQAEYFPVQLDHMGATFEFLQIADASEHFTGINNVETVVTAQRHNHPGGAYSFRIERNGKVLVICTDVEHGEQIDARLVKLARGADLLVHDAQYTAEELQKRRGWGHSSFDQAMQLAEMAGVKRLALTHHDPDHDDEFLERIEKLCQERFPNAVLAREGMEISIGEAT